MRKTLVALAILALVAAGADVGLRAVAESRLADEAQARLGLTDRPDVELEGFPFALHALRRRFPEASLEVADVRVEGLAIDRIVLELRDVRFESSSAVVGGGRNLTAGDGRGTLEVTQSSLRSYLERRDVPLLVELLESGARVSGTASVVGADVEATAEGDLAVVDGALEFRPSRVRTGVAIEVPPSALAFRVELPRVIPGMGYEGVTVTDRRLALSFGLRRTAIML